MLDQYTLFEFLIKLEENFWKSYTNFCFMTFSVVTVNLNWKYPFPTLPMISKCDEKLLWDILSENL